MRKLYVAAMAAVLMVACAQTKTRRVAIEDDDPETMGTGIESADVEEMARLAHDILKIPELTGPDVEGIPTIFVHPVKNNTAMDFDGQLFVERIQQQLVEHGRGKVRCVVRLQETEAVIEEERIRKRAGEVTSSKQETRTGGDFLLTGIASSISTSNGKKEANAIWVDFQLIDAENGEILWQRKIATKKVGKAGVVYR